MKTIVILFFVAFFSGLIYLIVKKKHPVTPPIPPTPPPTPTPGSPIKLNWSYNTGSSSCTGDHFEIFVNNFSIAHGSSANKGSVDVNLGDHITATCTSGPSGVGCSDAEAIINDQSGLISQDTQFGYGINANANGYVNLSSTVIGVILTVGVVQ